MQNILTDLHARVQCTLIKGHRVREARVEVRSYRIARRISRDSQTAHVESNRVHVHKGNLLMINQALHAFGEGTINNGQVKGTIRQIHGLWISQHGVA